jgi:uncharacterized membrane protein
VQVPGNIPQPVNVGQQWLKLGRRKRILLAAACMVDCFLAGVFIRWIGAPSLVVYLSIAPIAAFILLLALRPEWIAKLQRQEQERLEKWRTHPGQWMR